MASATVMQCLNCSLRLTPLRRRHMLSKIPNNIMDIYESGSHQHRLQCEKCCYCIDLELGCVIIAWLGLITYSITIPIILFFYFMQGDLVRGKTLRMASMVMEMLMAIPRFAFCVLLLVGLKKERPRLVMYFLIFMLADTVLSFIDTIGMFIGPISWDLVFSSILMTLIKIYAILIVRSHYLEMSEGGEPTSN